VICDLPSSRQPTWHLIAQEAAAFAAAGLLMPFGIRSARRRTPRARDQRTVVLVHGYLGNRSTLFPLAAYLRLRGVKQILHFDYDSCAGVERGALGLRKFLRQNVRGGRIDLVGHSLGGLVARVYVDALGGARRVDRCVTLGTPHRGTYNSYWLWSRVGGELRPDSPLLARIAKRAPAVPGVRFLSLIAGSDNLVIPRVFAGHGREIVIQDVGHVSMLFSPSMFRLIGDFLAEPAPGVGEGALQGREAAAQRAEGERRRAPGSPAHQAA
jgi:pimeloyl-ACP methyl ester carboxylesterase